MAISYPFRATVDGCTSERIEHKGEHVGKQREARKLNDAAERRSTSNTGNASVARARIERSAKRRAKLKGRPGANEYAGIVSDITSSTRYEAAARFVTHAPTVLLLE
jgi:hypothetical protein